MLHRVELCGSTVSRLICGGIPLSGFSHVSQELDRQMVEYYTMPNLQALLQQCWKHGIDTVQSRSDRHQMRIYLEHRQNGGKMQWVAQTASEFRDIGANIAEIARYGPIAIYHHGTHSPHSGEIDCVRHFFKAIYDHGLPADIGTYIPAVVEYAEENARFVSEILTGGEA